jgi:DMSO/TMAO reductase YedYZ heme-binding membrane subunit
MITLRRFLCIFALMFWQGGFTFYAAAVVPIAGFVLEPNLHLRARITDTVTNVLNFAGVAAILLLLWDFASSADPSRRRFRSRVVLLAILLATLAALFPLHYWLELLDPPEGTGPADSATFLVAHLIYVSVSAVQLLAALIYLGATLRAWRAEDAKEPRTQ